MIIDLSTQVRKTCASMKLKFRLSMPKSKYLIKLLKKSFKCHVKITYLVF